MYKYVLRNSLYLDDELQDYFNEMSKKGWRLDFVGYYYRFVKDEHVYKYQIDYTPVSSEYNEVLKEMEQTNKEIEQAEGIVRRYNTENDTWEMFVKEIPEAEKEFPSVMLEDQELKDELKDQKQIDLEVILDFTYLPVMVEGEEEGERPKNPLLFMAYDNTDGGVITMDILEEGDDEISRTLGFFISFVQQNGRMKTIKARNPWIFGALEDICEYCSVDLVYDPVEIMDQVIEEVISQL